MSNILHKDSIYKTLSDNIPDDFNGVLMSPKTKTLIRFSCDIVVYDDETIEFKGPDTSVEEHIREQMKIFSHITPNALPKRFFEDYICGVKPVKPQEEDFIWALDENYPLEYRSHRYVEGCFVPVNSIEDVERIKREWEEKQQKEKMEKHKEQADVNS